MKTNRMNRLPLSMCCVCLGMLFVATGQWAQAQTAMDANTILIASMSQFQQVPAYKMNCSATCDLIAEDGKTVVFRDGEKFEFRLNRYENTEENGLKIRHISNGQQYLIQQGQDATQMFLYSDDPNYIKSYNQTAWAGDFLDRYSLRDGIHIASYLLACPQKELLPTMESIEGQPCYVIHAASERGLIKIWIDPANGYQYRKLIIEKKHGNLEGDHKLPFKPIPQSDIELDQIKVEVDVQTIQKFDNVYFPLAGSIKVVQNFSDGSVKKFEYRAQRENIQFNPDFAQEGAFVIDIPEGATVYKMGLQAPPGPPLPAYLWHDGKMELKPEASPNPVGTRKCPNSCK